MIGSLSAVLVVYRRVKQTVVERNRHEVQAVLAEMQTVNALYVADIKIYRGKSSSVRMAETRPQKIFTRSSVFCLSDVCEQSIIRGSKKLFIELFFNGRGRLDYVRNVAKKFDVPEPDYPLSNSKNISSRRLMF